MQVGRWCFYMPLMVMPAGAAKQFMGQTQYCAEAVGWPYEDFVKRCCKDTPDECFDVGDSLGNKCCRQLTNGGFYGFLVPTLYFERGSARERRGSNGSLWSLHRFRVVSYRAQVSELLEVGVIESIGGAYSMRLMKDDPPLADRHWAHMSKDYLYRIYHQEAEVVSLAAIEHTRFRAREVEFRARLRERDTYRYGWKSCSQPEAGVAGIFSDANAMSWVAERWYQQGHKRLGSFINFGAGDGVGDDPLAKLVQHPQAVDFALAVEINPELCEAHRYNLPHVKLICKQLRIDTIPALVDELPLWLRNPAWEQLGWSQKRDAFDDGSLPALDAVKVDLDSHDCDILEAFLLRVPAKFVATEVFDGVPPPIQFAMHESSESLKPVWASERHSAFGCSLSYQVHLLGSLGYMLVWYSAANAVFAHRRAVPLLDLPAPLDEVDCFAKSVVHASWPDGRTLRRWFQEVSVSKAAMETRDALSEALAGAAFTVRI